MVKTNIMQSDSVYLESKASRNYDIDDDVVRPRILTFVDDNNVHLSGYDATRPHVALIGKDDKPLTSSPQHVRNDDKRLTLQ